MFPEFRKKGVEFHDDRYFHLQGYQKFCSFDGRIGIFCHGYSFRAQTSVCALFCIADQYLFRKLTTGEEHM